MEPMHLFYQHGLTSIPAWISDHIHYNVWDKLLISNFNGCKVEIWEWINNIILHFTMDIIIYPGWDYGYSMILTEVPDIGKVSLEYGNV